MASEKGPKETPGLEEKIIKLRKPKSPEKKEKVPSTNEGAKKVAKKGTDKAKQKAKGRVEKAKKAKEKIEKPKVTTLTICGKKVDRKIVNGKVVFVEKDKKTSIGNLSSWVEEKMKDKELQKQIDTHLKPFASHLKQLGGKKRSDAVKKLNDTKFSKLEFGKVDVYGIEIDDSVQKAAYLASMISKKTSSRKLTISASDLDKVKHKPYLDYQHVLPVNVRTIVITRNGKKMVCSRAVSGPEKGGRVSYVDVTTGKRIYLKGGDGVQIVGTVSVVSMEYKNVHKAEQSYAKVRSLAGKTWMKDSDKIVDFNPKPKRVSSRGGGYSGGYSGGGSSYSAPSSSPSGMSSPVVAPGRLAPNVPALTQTPEVMKQHCTQETFRLLGKHMFASMLSPNLRKYPKLAKSKPKLMVYFAGRGHYDAISEFYKQHGQSKEPTPEVLAEAAREDFLSSKKRIFGMLKSRWEKGENVHFVLVSHMRPYLHKKDSGASKYWYGELQKQNSAKAIFDAVISKYKAKSGAKSVSDISLIGHSMGGKALAGISKLKEKGLLPYNFSYFSSDASYWYLKLGEIKRNKKAALYISYRPGTKTEEVAQSIVGSLKLKGQKRGSETVFTNPKYPNVRVVATSVSHSAHPGQYLNPAWELAQRAQAGNLKSSA